MKKEDLIDAFGRIDEQYIAEADEIRKAPEKKRLPVWIPVFAAAALCAAVILPNLPKSQSAGGTAADAQTEEISAAGVNEEAAEKTEEETDPAVRQDLLYTYQAPGIPGTWEYLESLKEIPVYTLTELTEEEMTELLQKTAECLGINIESTVKEENMIYAETDNCRITVNSDGTASAEYNVSAAADPVSAAETLSSQYDDPYVYETEFYDEAGDLLYSRTVIKDSDNIHFSEVISDSSSNLQKVTVYAFSTTQSELKQVKTTEELLKDIPAEEDVVPPAEMEYVLEDGLWIPCLMVYASGGDTYPSAWIVCRTPVVSEN